jgi:hypothetical protein
LGGSLARVHQAADFLRGFLGVLLGQFQHGFEAERLVHGGHR